MYVRCPRCKSEISFEPTNMSSLGDRYKIKCPNCGATIGAKLPTEQQLLSENSAVEAKQAKSKSKAIVKKKSGAGRNVVLLFLSLIFVVMTILSYLITKGTLDLKMSEEIAQYMNPIFGSFSGITSFDLLINDFDIFKDMITSSENLFMWAGISHVLNMGVFVFSAICLLASFISLCARGYSRAFNMINNTLLAGCTSVLLFTPYLAVEMNDLGEYFTTMINTNNFGSIILAALGVLVFFFTLCFLGSLKVKGKATPKAQKNVKAEKAEKPKKEKKSK